MFEKLYLRLGAPLIALAIGVLILFVIPLIDCVVREVLR
jgi:hypothetical protein